MKTYSITQFNSDYPNDDVCIDTLFQNRYGALKVCPGCGVIDTKFYRVKKRKCYACMHCGHQLHPLAGTIFHKSDTALTKWFFAIFLFANSKNGVSAKELERHLGVTYKTAWRIAKQIRKLMDGGGNMLSGVVEADETYVGGVRRTTKGSHNNRFTNKTIVMGAVERGGEIRAQVVPDAKLPTLMPILRKNVDTSSHLMTDEHKSYWVAPMAGYQHSVINHHKKKYVVGEVHTNTIEGFWSQLKRSVDGTYHAVSPKYLQQYVNEFAYRYNRRDVPIYPLMIQAAAKPV